jgi:arylsulfatase A
VPRFLIAFAVLVAAVSSALTADRPNFVVILADDMGYGDVHGLNPKSRLATPNLDGLMKSGMFFSDAHTPSSVCTPTRYGLLTGRYCWRSRLKSGVQNGYGPPLIEEDRPTIASFLKSHGYRTGIVGKWHLGLGFVRPRGAEIDYSKPLTHTPNDLGFEESLIIPASLDFPPYVYIRNRNVRGLTQRTQPAQKFPAFLRKGPISSDFDMEDCLDHLTENAVEFISESAKSEKPFFLYFPLTAPHKPVLPHKRFRGKTALGPYGDFVAQVDWTVGQVLKAIDDAGVRDNTFVLYTSDNGSFMRRQDDTDAKDHVDDDSIQAYNSYQHRANGVFRGTKADIWEAGHRVPFLVRWPNRTKPGSESKSLVCLTDVFATMAEIVGKEMPEGAGPDSFSFVTQIYPAALKFGRPPVIHHSSAGMFAIRIGDAKLVLGNGSGGREQPKGKPFQKPYQLFNLRDDIGETKNIIDSHRKAAESLEKDALLIRDNEGKYSR